MQQVEHIAQSTLVLPGPSARLNWSIMLWGSHRVEIKWKQQNTEPPEKQRRLWSELECQGWWSFKKTLYCPGFTITCTFQRIQSCFFIYLFSCWHQIRGFTACFFFFCSYASAVKLVKHIYFVIAYILILNHSWYGEIQLFMSETNGAISWIQPCWWYYR